MATATTFGPYPHTTINYVHDGDTANVTIEITADLGFGFVTKAVITENLRVYGINAPELSTDAGKVAAAYAKTLLTPGMVVSVLSYGWDKYGGRFDALITLPDGRDFAQLMLDSGNAVPMKG